MPYQEMASLVTPELAYTLLIVFGSLAVMGLGAVVFFPRIRPGEFCMELVQTDWQYLGVAWLVSAIVTELAYRFHTTQRFTGVIYGIEGSAVAAFQTVATTPLTVVFVAAYVVGLPSLVVFTYFELKFYDEREARRYTLAYVVLVVLSLPFFVLMPVGVPGLYAPDAVEPLMFSLSPILTRGIRGTDTMVKAFPSLHTGLAVLAALYARKASARYAAVTAILAGMVVVSTFYLGIHWITDAGFAVVLVGVAYWVSRRVDPDQVLPIPALDRLRSRSTGSGHDADSMADD